MTKKPHMARIETGIPNFDAILGGGLPKGSAVILSGPPGSGKTILSQQIGFHNASPEQRVLYFGTLSEPTAKTIRFLRQLSFFDPEKLRDSLQFVDLGVLLRAEKLVEASELIKEHVKRVKPTLVVIDSFKVFEDLSRSRSELRKFSYEIAINLMAWETTALLLGEYPPEDYQSNPLFSIVDGLILVSQRESSGENQRFIQLVKMRGTEHSRDSHPFRITEDGVTVFASRVTMHRRSEAAALPVERRTTRIAKLDELVGPGIPAGSNILLGGVAGTGKTVLSLEFLYRGALAGEKGIIFSFEETEDRLRASARGFGWDLDGEIERGTIEIVFIPQPDIEVEPHLAMMRERIARLGATRVVIDSVSMFLHKVGDPQLRREKMFHLCSIVQNANAIGFYTSDIPYGVDQISRHGVEETIVDGVILLTSTQEGLERQRYIEVYKLRNTAHLKGRHNMLIAKDGISIFPRYGIDATPSAPPPALDASVRLPSGVAGLDALLGGGFLRRSVTLLSGSAGTGKSTLAMQYLLAGAAAGERGLYISLEEGPAQLVASADALGLPLRAAVDQGLVEILYVSREHIRAGQFLTVLGDRLEATGARRLVIDAVTHMLAHGAEADELRHILYKLAARFKALDVTSLLTLEVPPLFARDEVTEGNLSPIADNLLMLRYRDTTEGLVPVLTVVKTRGSPHDARTFSLLLGANGVGIGSAVGVLDAGSSGSEDEPGGRGATRQIP